MPSKGLSLTHRVLDKSLCQIVALPAKQDVISLYTDAETGSKVTTDLVTDGEINRCFTILYLNTLRARHMIMRDLRLLDVSVVYVINMEP